MNVMFVFLKWLFTPILPNKDLVKVFSPSFSSLIGPTSQLTSDSLTTLGVLCQDDDDETERKLCKDKSAGELFRLKEGEENCRDVIQCTAAVS